MAQTSTSQPVHPAIVFEVDLSLNATESIGPNTNVSNPHMLHPGGFPDNTLTAALRSAHLEGVTHIDDGDLDMDGDGISEGDIMNIDASVKMVGYGNATSTTCLKIAD